MKDAATGFGFLAMCGLVSIGLFVGSYAVDVVEYALEIHSKAEAYDVVKANEPVFEKTAGMMLPVGRK